MNKLLIIVVLFIILCRLQGQPHRACLDGSDVSYFYNYIVLRFSVPSPLADIRTTSRRHSKLN